MSVVLKVVSDKSAPEVPYPADTKVRGWKFQLDHERINQSDTWALAPPDMRPWLLMLWHVAWQQIPAGSFSNDDAVIAAKIGMELRQFKANRDILLRGWILHADGRLYHQVIIEQVFNYQEHNNKERKRITAWREKKKAEKQAKSNADVTRNKHVCTTPEPEPEPEPSKANALHPPYPPGMDRLAWDEYTRYRQSIKARKLKPRSEQSMQAWLAEQGPPETQRAIVEQTIRNGWTGLFEIKQQGNRKATSHAELDAWTNQGNTIEGELDD